jgi:hypothetical protein
MLHSNIYIFSLFDHLQDNFIFSLSLLSYIIFYFFNIHLLKSNCVLHCFYDLETQLYIVLCSLIFILHDNFMLKEIFFLHVAIER